MTKETHYARIVADLRQSAVTTDELASIAGVRSRQVENWAAGRSKPRGENRDRLLELHYLGKRLHDVYRPEGVEIWLHARKRSLDGRRPIDLLRAGEFETVLSDIERLDDGEWVGDEADERYLAAMFGDATAARWRGTSRQNASARGLRGNRMSELGRDL